MDLFTNLVNSTKQVPLAETLRPQSLDDLYGQETIINPESPVFKLIKSGHLISFILWGPAGCGKTTFARLIAQETDSHFIELSAVNSGTKELKESVEQAKENLRTGSKTIIFIDEIHRYNKTQQDALLPYLENGTFYLIGASTENPSFQVIPALLSRVHTIIFTHLHEDALKQVIQKGFNFLSTQTGIEVLFEAGSIDTIILLANGDARIALNAVEWIFYATETTHQQKTIQQKTIDHFYQKNFVKHSVQDHYDLASAFQKSLRGSDPDAAIYWLARLIAAGEDPRFIARRLIITASEDVGNADPYAITIAMQAFHAIEKIGMPESRILLAQAVIYVAKAPKSNQAIVAIDKALADIERHGKVYAVPAHLKDSHYKDAKTKYGFGKDYLYTHAHPDAAQTFLPPELQDTQYVI